MPLEPDREQLEAFTDALFRHAKPGGFVSLRSFIEGHQSPLNIIPAGIGENLNLVKTQAVTYARVAANHTDAAVFCPPIATFKTRSGAKASDIREGVAISVECDKRPLEARSRLEAVLGPPTMVVASGGVWTDPDTGEVEPKLHLHWRLAQPVDTKESIAQLQKARDLATAIAGSDPASAPIVHPYRWPGSWHRKGEPILCRTVQMRPDIEIALAPALAALEAMAPRPNGAAQPASAAPLGAGEGWETLIASVLRGENYHHSLARLASMLVKAGTTPGAAVNLLRGLMDTRPDADKDERWRARYGDIGRAVNSALKFGPDPHSPQVTEPGKPVIVSSAEFVAGFVPPDYLVDGVMQRRYIYSLTARTGHGKTSIALLLAACVALGRTFGGKTVEKGRVLVLAGENPDDIRARWIGFSEKMMFDAATIHVHFVPGVFKISQLGKRVAEEVAALGGVALIIIDTSAAFFESDDANSNTQQIEHAKRMREFVKLEGGPCVLVNCHPVKNAAEDNLVPYGGGAFLNEVDGNLTGFKDGNIATVHWQGKFRGADFDPISFMLETDTFSRLKDAKGRLIPTVTARHLSDDSKAAIEMAVRSSEDIVVGALMDMPKGGTPTEIAAALGWHADKRKMIHKTLDRLSKTKPPLVSGDRGRYQLTTKGRKNAT